MQKADDGCSPHKMKTVKCGPGVDVCTEAVGAVETSKCHPVVPDYPFSTPPVWLRLLRDPPFRFWPRLSLSAPTEIPQHRLALLSLGLGR